MSNSTHSIIDFSLADVQAVLSSLNASGSTGPDSIHPLLLKSRSHAISLPLYVLFNKSLYNMSIPISWKSSNISPIFKKGSHSDPLNYCPITLTSVCSKTMERTVCPESPKMEKINYSLNTNGSYINPMSF